jgi:hypothetical protein
MILKDVDEQETMDKYQKAGLSAEKQMAFYLKRAFGSEENVLVLSIIGVGPSQVTVIKTNISSKCPFLGLRSPILNPKWIS